MSDLISRQALCDDLREYKLYSVPVSSDESEVKGYNDGIDLAISVIAKFPSTEPERTAKVTLLTTNSKGYWSTNGRCQSCGFLLERKHTYCPNCGVRLEWK